MAAAPQIIAALKVALDLLAANPVVAVTAAVVGLTVAIGTWIAASKEADEGTKAFIESMQETKAAYEELSETMAAEQETTAATAASLQELLAVEEKSALQKDLIAQKVDELNEAIPELGLAYDKERDSLEGLTEAELASALERAAAREEYEAQIARLNELDNEREAIEARLTEARLALNEAEETGVGNTRELNNNINELTAALEENATQYAELEAASAEYAEQQAAIDQKTQEATRTVDGLISEMNELQEAYNESYAAAMESIDGQLGLFNELDGSAKTSINNLIGTLQGQVSYMETYAANIQKAMELGVDEGLIRKLSDGSEESAQILAAIVEGGEEDIAALNEQLAKVEEGKEAFSETVAEMETDFSDKMKDIEDRVKEMADELDASAEAQAAGMATIDGYVDLGYIPGVSNKDLPIKAHKKDEKKKGERRAARLAKGKSIEERPREVNTREEVGHWEMDTVLSAKDGSLERDLGITERATRNQINIKIKNGETASVVAALDALERKLGDLFPVVFRSITVDNGSEFADVEGIERSCLRKGEKRTTVYYCHPYRSSERGSNEKQNGMLRRRHPKGTDFKKVSRKKLRETTDWINNYPRVCFKTGRMPDWGRFFRQTRRLDAGILTDFKSNQRSPGGKRCLKTAF